ncbi:hypothetical protein CO010_03580 [Candidatus Shapirobacteria bacterium CG_4_8_14_3_um_filter_39_11]|uniref:Glycosyltransferase RgtA/B/C/D-like domain-containing protein n=1 Tax=Candidatus Shapirobacteria bacterium CG_4_8_14_3_um_filter_39_11 TaxID=1974875 RepID=A0A2M8GFL2_9BACT|nr:MAG: hypothetical protein CO010_03580 [Candidatus Shapirobacteria bacterium CG_4_8_14_3_um_filter_39_11]
MKKKLNFLNKNNFYWIFIPFLLLTFFYLFKVPIGQTPDEPAHLNYIKHLAIFGSLPDYNFSGVAHHPPFYYLILTPIFILFKNIYVLRGFYIVFSLLNLLVIKKIVELIIPSEKLKRDLSLGTAIFCSLIPMYNFMAIGVNNDSLACLLGSLLIYYSVLSLNRFFREKEYLLWSLVFMAAIFTKIILWPAVFISGLTVLFTQKKQKYYTLLCFLLSFIGLCFWFYRNVSLYGQWDILGWEELKKVEYMLLGNRLIYDHPRQWLVLLFHSFWGIFGWFSIYLPLVAYSLLRKATFLLILPFALFIINFFIISKRKEKLSSLLFFSFFILTFVALIKDNLTFFHPQGRYLFPMLSFIGFYYTAGLFQISKYISKYLFKVYRNFVFYTILVVPLLILNIVSLITISNFYSK